LLLLLFSLLIFFFVIGSGFSILIIVCEVDLLSELDASKRHAFLNPRSLWLQGNGFDRELLQYSVIHTRDHIGWLYKWEAERWLKKERLGIGGESKLNRSIEIA